MARHPVLRSVKRRELVQGGPMTVKVPAGVSSKAQATLEVMPESASAAVPAERVPSAAATSAL